MNPAMEPRIQYAKTSDGVNIAYWTLGEGEPFVLCYSPGASHIQMEWDIPDARWAYTEFARHRTLVRFDFRNNGLSTRGVHDVSVESYVRDLEAVLDRLKAPRLALLGGTLSSKLVIRYAAEHPEHVSHLVLHRPTIASGSQHFNWPALAMTRLIDEDWDLFCDLSAVAALGLDNPDFARRISRLMRDACTPEDFKLQVQALARADVTALLPNIRSPVLLLHRISREFDINIARAITAGLPNARMAVVEGSIVSPWEEPSVRAIEEFLSEGEPRQPGLPSGTVVILFADIADSTALTERLGDAVFRAKARELGGSLRALIRECGGTPVEGPTLGDGVLAVFTSAREAIEAAVRCRDEGSHAGLPLHVGLHAGDVMREKDPDGRANVYGGAVNIAARIAGASAAGEILVSDIVRGLARTSSGVTFEERGEHELKGVGEPVRVFAVSAPP